jgi:hypothetical protein
MEEKILEREKTIVGQADLRSRVLVVVLTTTVLLFYDFVSET